MSLLRIALIQRILNLKNFESAKSIIIFSEARGGSTWLMEIMSDLLPVCINWEPLHVNNGVVPKEKNFGWRPFIPEADSNPDNYLLFKKIHEYKVCTSWTTKYLSLVKIFKSKYVLTKYVRANLLVPYLTSKYEFAHKPIYLIRHPIDTCLSQIRAFGDDENISIANRVPQCMNNERFVIHREYLNGLESKLELKIAYWCINNCRTLNKLAHSKVCVVFYSDLIMNPQEEVNRILISTKLDEYNKDINKLDFRRASMTDFKNDLSKSAKLQLQKNIDELDVEMKDRIQSIFDYFGLNLYSAYSSRPNKQYLAK